MTTRQLFRPYFIRICLRSQAASDSRNFLHNRSICGFKRVSIGPVGLDWIVRVWTSCLDINRTNTNDTNYQIVSLIVVIHLSDFREMQEPIRLHVYLCSTTEDPITLPRKIIAVFAKYSHFHTNWIFTADSNENEVVFEQHIQLNIINERL
ncbi:hypothetical protein CSKR_108218, partial [Clonorchis sinensis]